MNKKWEEYKHNFESSKVRMNTFRYFILFESGTSTTIGKYFNLHPKSIHTYLKEFEEDDLIQQYLKDNKREKWYKPTEKGKELISIISKEGWFISQRISEVREIVNELQGLQNIDIHSIIDNFTTLKENLDKIDFNDLKIMVSKLKLLKEINDLNNK